MAKLSNELNSGFRRAGWWLLGFAWLVFMFAGLAIAFTPSRYSPAIGWMLLAVSAAIATVTTERWIKIFPGLLAYGILGSIITLVDGHAVNHPEVRVTHIEAAFMIVFFAVTTILSLTFLHRRLNALDRVALVVFIFCFFGQAAAPNLMRLALGIGFSCLLIVWVYDRIRRHHGDDKTYTDVVV